MLFNSIEYFIFLPIVFILYWSIQNKKTSGQNLLILLFSYFFYGWWDWRFLFLIFFSTLVDYYCGLLIYKYRRNGRGKMFLWISIIFNISILGFFKYYNFFIESWIDLFHIFGFQSKEFYTFNIILPVGISFYTFQTMSYSLDIYFNNLKPTKSFISFASFVSFFPQLVSGPIERASNLLPQILNKRIFNNNQTINGLKLILWGLFKKVVLADSLSIYVDYIFNNYHDLDGGILILGIIYFSFQLYCDFSGYSDIAIGSAKLFGIELISNFNFPFFSTNPIDFWNKWHISLSSWVKDYLYTPFALFFIRNFNYSITKFFPHLLIMIIIGLWHGANWTFMFFGLYWGVIICLYLIISTRLRIQGISNNILFKIFSTILMYVISCLGFLIFRSPTLSDMYKYFYLIIEKFNIPKIHLEGFYFILILLLFDWTHRRNERRPLQRLKVFNKKYDYLNKGFYFLMISAMFWTVIIFTFKNNNQFLYFQF
tara:strand:+ start:584 stop:2035 length:1452 start_codon:yes stop_codon:yes gene_type:complete